MKNRKGHGYLPLHQSLVVMVVSPTYNSDCIILNGNVCVQKAQGLQCVGEINFNGRSVYYIMKRKLKMVKKSVVVEGAT